VCWRLDRRVNVRVRQWCRSVVTWSAQLLSGSPNSTELPPVNKSPRNNTVYQHSLVFICVCMVTCIYVWLCMCECVCMNECVYVLLYMYLCNLEVNSYIAPFCEKSTQLFLTWWWAQSDKKQTILYFLHWTCAVEQITCQHKKLEVIWFV